ncbi:hypothetical protein C8E00_103196 [Chromohalobacter marismortui]|uniref:Uncharacterized protein n=1 Tax=Chromohalobacter marismortui TaxID=42055 RepID=A0A4R7NPK7_9GAMM|nr:hypothetical protein C8E00_103196 [Chromohalobacter marismortui]
MLGPPPRHRTTAYIEYELFSREHGATDHWNSDYFTVLFRRRKGETLPAGHRQQEEGSKTQAIEQVVDLVLVVDDVGSFGLDLRPIEQLITTLLRFA